MLENRCYINDFQAFFDPENHSIRMHVKMDEAAASRKKRYSPKKIGTITDHFKTEHTFHDIIIDRQ